MTERRYNYLFKDMELILKRDTFTEQSTIGKLTIDGLFECFVLEDKDRGLTDAMDTPTIAKHKVYGKTCIPYGRYEIDWTLSNRFKVFMPILLKVKGYEGIRIHKGNTEIDSLGCLLPCSKYSKNFGSASTVATNKLYAKIEAAKKQGQKIFITITK